MSHDQRANLKEIHSKNKTRSGKNKTFKVKHSKL